MKLLIKSFLWLLLIFIAVAFIGWRDADDLLRQPLAIKGQRIIELESGRSFNVAIKQWQSEGLLKPERLGLYLKIYARLSGRASRIKAGEYELKPGINSLGLLDLLVSGRVVMHELRLIEGMNFSQMMAQVHENAYLLHTLKEQNATAIMEKLGHAGEHPEGRFFPDTYRFSKGTTDAAILKQAYNAMQKVLADEWKRRDENLPYSSPEEALIMASIVEKETGQAAERPEIAGVFVRRLHLDMKLQTDPTVIYGLGEKFDGNLRRDDLLNDSPYNSYTRKGLPPTPICMPGRAAIRAALHPDGGKSLFFVAKGDGTHQFSVTLDQHNQAVRQYQLKMAPLKSKKRSNKNK